MGREPSGTKFNSLIQLELESGLPRNLFINAGAHVVTDIVMTQTKDAKKSILDLLRKESMIMRHACMMFCNNIC